MAYEFIVYEKSDRIARLTINRPEVMNALHPPANAEMRSAFEDFRDDEDAWVLILTGAGDRAFSAGNDLKATAARSREPGAASGPPVPLGGITADFECDKPLIAAVNGFAMGGGFELALACDIIVAAEQATFALPEPRVGLVAAASGMHRLPQHVPLKIAMGMMLTGRRIDAQEAFRIGLVNEVVPLPGLMAAAERWAGEILECAPLSVRVSKASAIAGLQMSVDEAMRQDRESGRIARVFGSEDFVEGPRAFTEKRKPVWKGR